MPLLRNQRRNGLSRVTYDGDSKKHVTQLAGLVFVGSVARRCYRLMPTVSRPQQLLDANRCRTSTLFNRTCNTVHQRAYSVLIAQFSR